MLLSFSVPIPPFRPIKQYCPLAQALHLAAKWAFPGVAAASLCLSLYTGLSVCLSLSKCEHKLLCKSSPLLIESSRYGKKPVENLIFNKPPDGAQIGKLLKSSGDLLPKLL